MESTGVWIPLFAVLEERGFEVMLVTRAASRTCPGARPTCWTASGCSCTPTDCCREPSGLTGTSGACACGPHPVDPDEREAPARHRKPAWTSSRPWAGKGTPGRWRGCAIPQGGRGDHRQVAAHWREEHIFELTQALEHYQGSPSATGRLKGCMRTTATEPPAPNGKKRNQKNAPRFDVQGQLYRMTGVDLTRIDGVDAYTALKVISEIGAYDQMAQRHFASWWGVPTTIELKDQAQRQPGGGGISGGQDRSDSALVRRKKAHLRHHRHRPQAGQDSMEAWPRVVAEYYESQYQPRCAAKRRAAQLGYQLVPVSDGEHH